MSVFLCLCVRAHVCALRHLCEQINKMFIVAEESFSKNEITAEVGK
jgi:predicted HD phosphohydrolase